MIKSKMVRWARPVLLTTEMRFRPYIHTVTILLEKKFGTQFQKVGGRDGMEGSREGTVYMLKIG
jgi:hypothetical protein